MESMRTTLSQHYIEFVDPSVNASKFYLCVLFEENGRFLAHTQWGRRGAEGQSKILYAGPNRNQAQSELDKKYNTKRAEGYRDTPVSSNATAIIKRLERLPFPGAAPAPAGSPKAPTTPAAPVRNLVPCPEPMPIQLAPIRPNDFVVSIPLGRRAFCVVPPQGAVSLLAPEKAVGSGRPVADPKGFTPEALKILSKLDTVKSAIPDTILDTFFEVASKTLVIIDVLRFRGTVVANYPLAHRLQILEEIEAELREDGQLHAGWRIAGPTPQVGWGKLARALGDPYAPGKSADWHQFS